MARRRRGPSLGRRRRRLSVQIGLYRGIAAVSELIEWETRSVYSHAAAWFPDVGELWEAENQGFVCARSLGENHQKGTVVDLLEYKAPLTPAEEAVALATARGLKGEAYDFGAIEGFVLRLGYDAGAKEHKLFCSEAVFIICAAMGPERVLLERTQPWKVAPEHINLSPLLKWVGSFVC